MNVDKTLEGGWEWGFRKHQHLKYIGRKKNQRKVVRVREVRLERVLDGVGPVLLVALTELIEESRL